MLLKELMGFNYIFVGQVSKGKQLLEEVKGFIPDYAVTKDSMAEDYLLGNADADAIKTIFIHVDETRESIPKKRNALADTVNHHRLFSCRHF